MLIKRVYFHIVDVTDCNDVTSAPSTEGMCVVCSSSYPAVLWKWDGASCIGLYKFTVSRILFIAGINVILLQQCNALRSMIREPADSDSHKQDQVVSGYSMIILF